MRILSQNLQRSAILKIIIIIIIIIISIRTSMIIFIVLSFDEDTVRDGRQPLDKTDRLIGL